MNMKKISVLIADNNPVLLDALSKEISDDTQLELIAATDNGKDAYEIITTQKPDVAVFDLLLPYYDGFTLVEKIKTEGIVSEETKLVMSSPLTNDSLTSEIFRRGVDYVLAKPYDLKTMTNKIKKIYTIMNSSMYKYGESHDIDYIISDILTDICIPANLTGYKYIITAIKEVINDDSALEGITKILYPSIAKKHNSTPQRVEKAIRHAIEVAWSQDNDCKFKNNYNFTLKSGKLRPTNSEFIAVLSRQIRSMM